MPRPLTKSDKIIIGVVVGVLVIAAIALGLGFGINWNADVILVAGNNNAMQTKLKRSIDGGETWTEVTSPLSNIKSITHDGTRFYAASSTPPQFCTSVDGGLTWTEKVDIPEGVFRADQLCVVTGNGKGAAVACGNNTGIAYYDGKTWSKPFALEALGYVAFNGETCAVPTSEGVRISVDRGKSWEPLGPPHIGYNIIRQDNKWLVAAENGLLSLDDAGNTSISYKNKTDLKFYGIATNSQTTLAAGVGATSVLINKPKQSKEWSIINEIIAVITLAWTGKRFVGFGTSEQNPSGVVLIGSPDGKTWKEASKPWAATDNVIMTATASCGAPLQEK
jgi:hypothetical protein